MDRNKLKKMLDELKAELAIPENEEIRIELKPMKIKAASISLKRNVIRINKYLINSLDEDSIKYIILHELIHYKLKSIQHNSDFHNQLAKKFDKKTMNELDRKIIKKLLTLNDTPQQSNQKHSELKTT